MGFHPPQLVQDFAQPQYVCPPKVQNSGDTQKNPFRDGFSLNHQEVGSRSFEGCHCNGPTSSWQACSIDVSEARQGLTRNCLAILCEASKLHHSQVHWRDATSGFARFAR